MYLKGNEAKLPLLVLSHVLIQGSYTKIHKTKRMLTKNFIILYMDWLALSRFANPQIGRLKANK